MSWVAGIRNGTLYTVKKRPMDPRWSRAHRQKMLGLCATGLHIGLNEIRAFQAAEALIMAEVCPGIEWPNQQLRDDMDLITKGLSCL